MEPYRELAPLYFLPADKNVAIALFQQAIQLAPNEVSHYLALISYYTRQGLYQEGLPIAQRAVKRFPTNADLAYLLGTFFVGLSMYDSALPHFEKSFALQPSAQAAFSIGNLLGLQGRAQAAIPYYQQALSLDEHYYSAIYFLKDIKMRLCDWSARATDEATIIATIEQQIAQEASHHVMHLLSFNTFPMHIELHQRYNRFCAEHIEKNVVEWKKNDAFCA
ncbi:MAG: tetratricopeptide repeat protein [Saprospiraceae bacterium]|nr:tetratricopeptide repeat protein [Saprospiraceae bacterium]